jgi:hypothetical protein
MTNKYDWLLKKTPRSVEGLKLWNQNPRLDPEGSYETVSDVASELISNDSDRKDFIELLKSISERGFIPADPVVIWQGHNKSYYVAEGNRRVLALKLLLNPNLSPKAIKTTVTKLSGKITKNSIKKIPVAVAPTFDDAEWYISQRNSISSLQRRWTSEQQRRWLLELYNKYEGNIEDIRKRIDLSESELQKNIRILKLKDLVEDIKDRLTPSEYAKATTFRFPISTFERFFYWATVQREWGIEFDGYNVKFNKNKNSFLNAYSELIKRLILPEGDENRIDSRSINSGVDIENTLKSLPAVEEEEDFDTPIFEQVQEPSVQKNHVPEETPSAQPIIIPRQKDNPNRTKLIDDSYVIVTDIHRLNALFDELKRIPLNSYTNIVASAIRILLELSVDSYLKRESLESQVAKKQKRGFRDITLHEKLVFLKENISGNEILQQKLSRFLNPTNEFSLTILNGYQHENSNHYLNRNFLNRFWDFLLPLFRELVEINESNE